MIEWAQSNAVDTVGDYNNSSTYFRDDNDYVGMPILLVIMPL